MYILSHMTQWLPRRVRVAERQQSCETYLGLQKSYILQRILKMSHGLELLLYLLKIEYHYFKLHFWFES